MDNLVRRCVAVLLNQDLKFLSRFLVIYLSMGSSQEYNFQFRTLENDLLFREWVYNKVSREVSKSRLSVKARFLKGAYGNIYGTVASNFVGFR